MNEYFESMFYEWDVEKLEELFGVPEDKRDERWERDVDETTMELGSSIIDFCVGNAGSSAYAKKNIFPLMRNARHLLVKRNSVYTDAARNRLKRMAEILHLGLRGKSKLDIFAELVA